MRKFVIAGLVGFAAASCGGGTTEPAAIDLVTVSGDTTVVIAGTTALTAAASAGGVPATAGVTFLWSSSDTAKATVNASGAVTGKTRGSVTITAEAVRNGTATGVSGQAPLRVRIGSVVIPSPPGTLTSIGDTVTLAAQAKDAVSATVGGVTIAWSSTNPGAATVDPTTGLLTAVANGTTSVIAAAQGERAADTVTVTVAQVATTLAIAPHTAGFTRIGSTLTPSVVANDARGHAVSGTAITWNSTVPAVASVDG
ncbi:MAG TPA: Ig-like domain-containing protein, partial [Gemmatimonadales bacterium]